MKVTLFLVVVISFEYFFDFSIAKGLNLGICDDKQFTCKCGVSNYEFKVAVKQCSFSHRWKLKCKPCGKVDKEEVCRKYQYCEQCYINGGEDCATCPTNRFGRLCENDCTCVNGASCERDGSCTCTEGFEGQNCENKKGCFQPAPLSSYVQVVHSPSDIPIQATYSCPENYLLRGSAVSTCLSNKQWSSDPPVCLPMCTRLNAPANGKLKYSSDELVENTFAEVTCDSHHRLIGEKTIRCLAYGRWSGELAICVNACDDPPIPIGGLVTYLSPLNTRAAHRAALQGGSMAGLRRSHLSSGLSGIVIHEGSIPSEDKAETISLPPSLHRIGERAMFNCESNYYNLIGSKTRRCQGNGEWSGRPPTCIPVCGRSDSPRAPFIVNGNATDIGQWPWQAGIARHLPDFDRWFLLCGASLLNERWLITAAHCVTYTGTTAVIDPDKFQVYIGKYHRQDSKDDEYVQLRNIQEIHIHPDYDPVLFDADIALIQLDDPVQLNSRVRPVCLPTEQTTRENLAEGKMGVVTGWGLNENDTYSEILHQAVLPFVSQEVCEKGYVDSDLPLTVTDNMFCAGFAKGHSDACSGDSGGPMVFIDESSKERKWVLEGVVSWGSPQGCGNSNQYGGFTTVSKYLDWIHLFF